MEYVGITNNTDQWTILMRILHNEEQMVQRAWRWIEKNNISWIDIVGWVGENIVTIKNNNIYSHIRFMSLPISIQRNILSLLLVASPLLPPLRTLDLLHNITHITKDDWCLQLVYLLRNDIHYCHPEVTQHLLTNQDTTLLPLEANDSRMIESLASMALEQSSDNIQSLCISNSTENSPIKSHISEPSKALGEADIIYRDQLKSDEELASQLLDKIGPLPHPPLAVTNSEVEKIGIEEDDSGNISKEIKREDLKGTKRLAELQSGSSSSKRKKATTDIPDDISTDNDLPIDMQAMVDNMKILLVENGGKGIDSQLFTTATGEQTNHIHQLLQWNTYEVDVVCEAISTILGPDTTLSYRSSIALVHQALLPKVISLKQAPSRRLLSTIQGVANHYPKAIIEGLVVPLFCTRGHLGAPQADTIGRLTKNDMTLEHLELMLKEICVTANQLKVTFEEFHVTVMQGLIGRQPLLDAVCIDALIHLLSENANPMASSLKFGTLIFTVIGKYGTKLSDHKSTLRAILECNKTFFKKTGLNALAKIP